VTLYKDLQNLVINDYGVSINARVGEPYGTFMMTGFRYNEEGEKIVNANGTYATNPNQVFGSYLPDWTGGMINTFGFRGFSLSATIDVRQGGNVYSTSNRFGESSGMFKSTVGLNDKGNPKRDDVAAGGGIRAEGVLASGERNEQYIPAVNYYKSLAANRENYLYDASFVKLREVKLSYSLPHELIAKTPFQAISVGVYGRNLAILHKNVPNIDPETALGSGSIQGYENGQHPSARVMGFNINLKL
jgi:hypothetical protein